MTAEKLLTVLGGVVWCIYSVTTFWAKRLWNWYWTKSRRDQLLETIDQVRLFEEWQAAAIQLDKCMDYDIWRTNSASKHYDWRFVEERFLVLWETEQDGDVIDIVNLIRSGLVRNLGNITAPRLYNRAYGGTKNLIEDYVTGVTRCIKYITEFPTNGNTDPMFTSQMKLDVLHDTRLAFGRTVLVLQGGAIFGLCHLGVVKALHLRGLLPRIISGTATGALIAALVCVHSEMELLDVLSGSGINVEAFASQQNGNGSTQTPWYDTLRRRFNRWWKTGHFLDVRVLEELLKSNIGDITFEEAYQKTKRILNITVTTSDGSGVPNLLNYITAPNVLIWSAALASNATSSSTLYDPVTLYCKNEEDTIVPWGPALQTTFRPWTHAKYRDRASPLHRIGELFNVNHFIVSQARPYLAPFLRSDTHHPNPKQDGRWRLTMPILRLVVSEVQHRLHQLNSLGLLSPSIRRFLLDESVPGTSLTLVPEISPSDFFKLLEHPTKEAIDYWILKGERSVWPAVTALKIRCAIEIEIDRGYQLVRRRRSSHSRPGSLVAREQLEKSGSQGYVRNGVDYDADAKSEEQQERRRRTRSFGDGIL